MDGFTLTSPAFPVAPANLVGFTVQGFAWVAEGSSTGATPERVQLIATDASRVNLIAKGPSQ